MIIDTELDPTKFPIEWHLLVLIIGFWAGSVRYALLLRSDKSIKFNWFFLAIEITISEFVAFISFWALLKYSDIDVLLSFFGAGILSHFAPSMIGVAEKFVSKQSDYFLGSKMNLKNKKDSNNDGS